MRGRNALVAGGALTAAIGSGDYRRWRTSEGARLELDSRVVTTSCGEVELVDEGQGAAVLVVHGSPGGYDSGRMFAHLLGVTGARVISPSRPGYLRTPLGGSTSPEVEADLLVAALDELVIDRAAVIGVSAGGPAALTMAARHPDRCSALVLAAAVTDVYSEAQMYRALPPLARLGKWCGTRALTSNLVGYLGSRAYLGLRAARMGSEPVILELVQSLARYDRRRVGYAADLAQLEHLAELPAEQVVAPTLILHGTDDTDVPCEQSAAVAERIPHARLLLETGATHFSLWGSARVRAEVAAFLRTAGVGG